MSSLWFILCWLLFHSFIPASNNNCSEATLFHFYRCCIMALAHCHNVFCIVNGSNVIKKYTDLYIVSTATAHYNRQIGKWNWLLSSSAAVYIYYNTKTDLNDCQSPMATTSLIVSCCEFPEFPGTRCPHSILIRWVRHTGVKQSKIVDIPSCANKLRWTDCRKQFYCATCSD